MELRICDAMAEAGISKPNSKEGIDFCLNCPYPDCIAFEDRRAKEMAEREENKKRVKEMWKDGCTVDEISTELGISKRTVKRYLSKK